MASRLVNRYHVPAIVFSVTDGVARGSGRSVGSVDLFHAVEQCSDVLVRFGGHAGAVGVTCEAARVDEFRERLCRALEELPDEQFEDTGEVTAIVRLGELSVESIASLELLQPFGQGNKKPLLASVGVSMRNRARVGADGAHVRFVATDGASCVPAIMFRAPDAERASSWEGVVDLVYEAVNETWQGRTKPKLMVRDILYRLPDAPLRPVVPDGVLEAPPVPGDDAVTPAEGRRAELARLPYDGLTDALRRSLIGDAPLLPAQSRRARPARRRSLLHSARHGDGAGQVARVPAARRARAPSRATGRASSSTRCARSSPTRPSTCGEGLRRLTASRRSVLTGETPAPERARVLAGLASGLRRRRADHARVSRHPRARRVAESRRVGFVVVDEAHHAGLARAGDRDAYLELPAVLGGARPEPAVARRDGNGGARASRRASASCSPSAVATWWSTARLGANLATSTTAATIRDRDAAPRLASWRSGEKTHRLRRARATRRSSLARALRHRVPELAHARRPSTMPGSLATPAAAVERRVQVRRAERASSPRAPSARGSTCPGVRHVVLYRPAASARSSSTR